MKEQLSWIVAGALCLVGIGAGLASASGSEVDDLKSKTDSLNKAIAEGIHSEESVRAIREPRNLREEELKEAASEFQEAKFDSALAAYRSILENRTKGAVTEGSDFSNSQWPTLKTSFDTQLLNIRKATERPPYWNLLGHRWVEDPNSPDGKDGKFLYEEAGATQHPYPLWKSPIEKLSDSISEGSGPFVGPEGKDGIHYGKLAIVCLDNVLKGIKGAIENGMKDQVFFLDTINFSNSFTGESPREYGDSDQYNRREFTINMRVAPDMKATLLTSLNQTFAASKSPHLRIVEIRVTQSSVPKGVVFKLTPELAKELSGKPFPETGREYDKWETETLPAVRAAAQEKGYGLESLPLKIELVVQSCTLKAETPVLDFSMEVKK